MRANALRPLDFNTRAYIGTLLCGNYVTRRHRVRHQPGWRRLGLRNSDTMPQAPLPPERAASNAHDSLQTHGFAASASHPASAWPVSVERATPVRQRRGHDEPAQGSGVYDQAAMTFTAARRPDQSIRTERKKAFASFFQKDALA
jgi:hypothetical protein